MGSGGNVNYPMDMHQKEQLHENVVLVPPFQKHRPVAERRFNKKIQRDPKGSSPSNAKKKIT